ncbi:MAG: hypothetical protein M3445_05640 [Actinomycetota bacterium]|nr:hypothetical protein [Actinomycetota bacterium]
MRNIFSNPKRSIATLAGVALLAVPLAACGTEDDGPSTSSNSSSSKQSAPEPVAAIEALSGGTTAIALDKGFTDALASLKLTPGVVGGAELTPEGSLVFPITGGNVTVFKPGTVSPYVIGQIQHVDSGLSLTAGDTTVELTNFNVDPGVSRVYGDVSVNGEVAAQSAYLFQLDGRTLKPLKAQGNQAILKGAEVKISDVAAPVLNDVFKTDAVKAGLLVGIATITVDVK